MTTRRRGLIRAELELEQLLDASLATVAGHILLGQDDKAYYETWVRLIRYATAHAAIQSILSDHEVDLDSEPDSPTPEWDDDDRRDDAADQSVDDHLMEAWNERER